MKSETGILNFLDKAFWAVWIALPFLIGARVYFGVTSTHFNAGAGACAGLPIIDFSMQGKILAGIFIGINVLLYLILLGCMHSLIRQFRRGSLFVEATLNSIVRIALLLLIWPFFQLIFLNLTSYVLFVLGDVSDWKLQYGLDLSLITSGMVILALRLVMSQAIKLHQDAQFTI